MATIKGTVSRVVSPTNFFIQPDDPSGHRFINLEGHRVGANGELSVECSPVELAKGQASRFVPWSGPMPKIGDKVELQVATGQQGPTIGVPSDEDIRAEAERRVQLEMDRIRQAPRRPTDDEVRAEAARRLQLEQQGSGSGSGSGGG